jgi:hypothetical protein
MTVSSLTVNALDRIGGLTLLELNFTADSADASFVTAEIGAQFHHKLHRIIVEPGSRIVANNPNDYIWTVSPAQAGEYYLTTASGGDPGLSKPDDVITANTVRTEAAAGSLTANQWDYDDNDTLGFDTIYYGGDPSAQEPGWIILEDAATAPTDNWDAAILDENFVQMGGDFLDNLDEALASFVVPKDSATLLYPDGMMLYGQMFLSISGNSVNSAKGTLKLVLEEIPDLGGLI